MNLFFYYANNINMKKMFILLIFLFGINRIDAIEDIKIDNNELIPSFNKDTKVYNYYTNKDKINVYTKGSQNEIIISDKYYHLIEDKTKIIISSSKNEKYEINVFKNYKKNLEKDIYLENLVIEGYDIEFNRDCYLYSINIGEEENLNINYELSNSDAYVSIEGNGNFNKSDNIIKINVNNDKEYVIHAYKSIMVSKIENDNNYKEMSYQKKEIVLIVIVTISCILVFVFYYSLFVNKSYLHI